ncbi:DgyrCDS12138 [Dimorphilus gyrociliatus]|uniref:DgyrCDS12138 n=1 Tax=Dimorphilus gyrociliatus TaxID=2664684 RepID=A0A7I8W7T0_9ANNE|nr:DgyrCDS12138 [Dimorphilus gyrociliatus]
MEKKTSTEDGNSEEESNYVVDEKKLKRIKNPRHWPLYRYSIQLDGDLTESGIGCYIRAMRNDLAKHELKCTLIENLSETLAENPFNDNADVISNLISIENKRDNNLDFELPIVISFPHQRYRKKSSREIVLRVLANGEWKDYYPLKDSKLLDFLESNSGQIPLFHCRMKTLMKSVKLCVVNKSRVESAFVKGNKALALVSYLDNRITLKIPKDACEEKIEKVEMQPLPNNPQMINQIKKYFKSSESLCHTSSLINLNLPSTIKLPMILSMPLPGTFQSKKLKSNNIRVDNRISKNLSIVTKTSKNNYHLRDDIRYEINNDIVTFPIEHNIKKIFLFETLNGTSNTDIGNVARNLELFNTRRKLANILIRQHEDDPEDIAIVCCNLKETDNEIVKMEERGYTISFHEPSTIEVCLKEGQRLQLKSKGNVRLVEEIQPFRFLQSKTMRMEGQLKVDEKYAQRGRPNYYGTIELLSENQSHCDVKVELPKHNIRTVPCHKVDFQIRQKGFLTSEYLRQISDETALKWRSIATSLNLSDARINAINLEHCTHREKSFKALQQWFKQTTLLQSGCKQLYEALQDNGYILLAEQLSENFQTYKEDDRRARERSLLQKAVHCITFDSSVQSNWEKIVEQLQLTSDFEDKLKQTKSVPQRLRQAFEKWMEMHGGSIEVLSYLLKDNHLINANRIVENLIRENLKHLEQFP